MISNSLFVRSSAALTSLFWASVLCAQERPIAGVVETAARKYMSDARSVGLSVGVHRSGSDFTFNFGSIAHGKAAGPTERTLYPIASITKTFTGTLLALAAAEGKLRLDDDVRAYLKGDFSNLELEGNPIRLSHLLNHRSGLPFILPDRPDLRPGYQNEPIKMHLERLATALSTYTRADFFTDLRQVRLTFVSGQKFQYSNTAAQLAGYILEDIYAASFGELITSKISAPLGMEDTAIKMEPAQLARLAQGHDDHGTVLPPPRDELHAAGSLKSTVADLLKYLRWHLAETDKAIQLSHRPTFTEKNYAAGLNWQILTSSNQRLIWQEGNIPGYTSYLLFEPELKLGVVLLSNESDRTSSQRLVLMANEILRALDARSILLP
jgi:serine-type D-Ala-D-Ala carboxypeptidase/endopeptidase